MTARYTDELVSRRGFLRTATGSIATVAAASGETAAQGSQTVEANDDLEFAPAEIQVSPGTTVTWENVGQIDHSVTAYGDQIPDDAAYWSTGDFDSESAAREGYPSQGVLGAGATYEYTFETEGTHDYFCIPHEQVGMKGTVVVGQGGGGDGDGGGDGGILPSISYNSRLLVLGILLLGLFSPIMFTIIVLVTRDEDGEK